MKAKTLGLTILLLAAAPGVSMASDKVVHLPFDNAVAAATQTGKLDGSVKFFLAGHQPAGARVVNDNVTISRKTNAFGKKDQESCDWVLQGILISLQEDAKRAGANAVTDIVSNYNNTEFRDSHDYECHRGFLMSGIALKAKFAKIRP
ncbi:excinuclease [Rhodanobacter sp. Col0626]|uniref:excinuclease n=1 Tax=Rhodanobacter sp. Col0626 TaxID=3415679 RepID=UPI003CF4E193